MIVIGYQAPNAEDVIEDTIVSEHEIYNEAQIAFNSMIEANKENENIVQFLWGLRLNPDEYQITAFIDKPV